MDGRRDQPPPRRRGAIQHPVAYLTCNLSRARRSGKPATFTHDEVITLFHEFGHGLHQLLTRVDVAGVSGIQGVEWDAVELPSQFMENFCWEWDVLSHDDARTSTPASRCRASCSTGCSPRRTSRAAWRRCASSSSRCSTCCCTREYDPRRRQPWNSPQACSTTVRDEVAVVPRPAYDRFMQSFAHVFAGGYAAGYYSYKWAEVLSADAFSLFEEEGVLSPAAGARFRDEVLARGGSRPALESFVAFRGRPPQLDALLRHNGMTEA